MQIQLQSIQIQSAIYANAIWAVLQLEQDAVREELDTPSLLKVQFMSDTA